MDIEPGKLFEKNHDPETGESIPSHKLDLFKEYMGIDDLKQTMKEANFWKKMYIFFMMGAFNFILIYKFLRSQPLTK